MHFNCSFDVDAPTLWNNLPLEIQTGPKHLGFRKMLKTYLFLKVFLHSFVILASHVSSGFDLLIKRHRFYDFLDTIRIERLGIRVIIEISSIKVK